MKTKNILLGLSLSLFALSLFFLAAEAATRLFWNAGYRHAYDWRDRTEGYTVEKGKNVFRILLLGDSMAYGQGVKREETFAARVEKSLNAGADDGRNLRYEVINLAWPGMNTADEYVVLVDKGLSYDPDLLLVAYYLNDVETAQEHRVDVNDPTYIRRPQNRRGRPGWEYALPVPRALDQFLTINSDFYIFLLQRYDSLLLKSGLRKRGGDGNDPLVNAYNEENIKWRHTKYSLSRMASLCGKRDIETSLLILPTFYNLGKYPYGDIHKMIGESALEAGYRVLDLMPDFAGKESGGYIVSRVDTHPNEKAHKVIAEKLDAFLRKENLVEGQAK